MKTSASNIVLDDLAKRINFFLQGKRRVFLIGYLPKYFEPLLEKFFPSSVGLRKYLWKDRVEEKLIIEKIKETRFKKGDLVILTFNHPYWKGNLATELTLLNKGAFYLRLNTARLIVLPGGWFAFLKRGLSRVATDFVANLQQIVFFLLCAPFLLPLFLLKLILILPFNERGSFFNRLVKSLLGLWEIIKFAFRRNVFAKEASFIDDFVSLSQKRKRQYFLEFLVLSLVHWLRGRDNLFPVDGEITSVKKIKRILVIKIDHLGDILHLFPSVAFLKKKISGVKIDVVVGPWGEKLVRSSGLFDNIFVYNPGTPVFDRSLARGREGRFSILRDLVCFIGLWRNNYDLLLDPSMPRIENIRLSFAIPAKARLGVSYKLSLPIYPWCDFSLKFKRREYEAIRMLRLLSPFCNLPADPYRFSAITMRKIVAGLVNKDKKKILQVIRRTGFLPGSFVALAPAAPWKYRMWPAEKYARLVSFLIDRGWKVILLGSESESLIAKQILKLLKRDERVKVLNLFGKTSLFEAVAVIERAKLFVCNDGGLFHFASVTNTPIVVIFGPGEFERWYPGDSQKRKAIYKYPRCGPCGQDYCPFNGQCTRRISVKEVIEKINFLLGEQKRV